MTAFFTGWIIEIHECILEKYLTQSVYLNHRSMINCTPNRQKVSELTYSVWFVDRSVHEIPSMHPSKIVNS